MLLWLGRWVPSTVEVHWSSLLLLLLLLLLLVMLVMLDRSVGLSCGPHLGLLDRCSIVHALLG